MITRPYRLPFVLNHSPPFSPRGLWMAVSKGGNPLDIVCNVFLNCPPSVPRTVLSGSRQGSRPNVAIGGKDKREKEKKASSDREFLTESQLNKRALG